MFKRQLRRFFPVCLAVVLMAGVALPASASKKMAPEYGDYEIITMNSVFPYASDDVGSETIRRECTWNSVVPAMLVLRSRRMLESTDADMATVTGKKLFIRTISIHANGASNFGGPKWIELEGTLTKDGELLGNFRLKRTTIGGKFSTCKALDYISEELIRDILKWLKKPTKMDVPVANKR